MPHHLRVLILFFSVVVLFQTTSFSQKIIKAPITWKNIENLDIEPSDNADLPNRYRSIQLDMNSLNEFLQVVPERFSPEANQALTLIDIPFPNGEIHTFRISKTNVMHPDLASRYPQIKTFSGISVERKNMTLALSMNGAEIRASILNGKEKIRILPLKNNLDRVHISFYVRDLKQETFEPWKCEVMKEAKQILKKDNPPLPESAGDCQLRTYRLALACTGGYSQKFGGTKNSVMAELVSTVANLNAVLEREVGIFLEMVPNNDDLIFLNANTDGYTEGDRGAMINENVDKCNQVIGSANYDIGHLFSITGGGLAGVGVVCGGSKARAVSGLSGTPSGYYFETIVLHEMGHQFSGGHTQNNDCNRSSFSAMETGSGSTILGYAGVCAPNVQFPADDYYHSISLQQIQSFTIIGLGSNCPEVQDLGNIAPNVDAGADHILPTDTYFELIGNADNPDDDAQTFSWDQMDNEPATAPPVSNSAEGPTFRSIYSVEDPIRIFPNINAIVEGTMPTWEVLPSVDRDMNFRFNVRDLHNGIGCAHEDDIELTFWNPPNNQDFRVIEPETLVTWFVGEEIPIQWSPAQTFEQPVDCERVDIYLSKDGGYTYPILLAENVLNQLGEHYIMVPNEVGTQNRIKVKCSDNVFFDISDKDFEIEEPPVPTFLINTSSQSESICGMELSEISFDLELTPIAGFTETVSFSADGLPAGATASFTPATIVAGGTVQVTISNLGEDTEEGDFEITVLANSTTQARQVQFDLQYFFNTPVGAKLVSPANGEAVNSTTQMLTWLPDPNARDYHIEIATNPSFDGNIVQTGTTDATTFEVQNLEFETVYYWRVRGTNVCGEGENSMVFAFQTPGILCETFEPNNVPVEIPNSGNGNVLFIQSTLNILESRTILDLNILDLNLEHSYIGDLSASLASPTGTSVDLFQQPGEPALFFGCNGRNMEVSFDDDALLTQADLEGQCDSPPPAISGDFQSLQPLSTFNNEEANGEWILTISDSYPSADGGNIQTWTLEVCSAGDAPIPADLTNESLTVLKGESKVISNQYLEASKTDVEAEELIFTLVTLPENGTLLLDDSLLEVGNQFTQRDIDNELFTYVHDDTDTDSDSFYFDVLEVENGWVGAQIFNINIVSLPVAQAILVSDIDCHNNNNGSIEAQITGGTTPYEYSLDGLTFQAESLFESLAEGTYQITVKDANGFSNISNEITITNPSPILATANTNIYDISVNATGGTGALSYSSNGVDFQMENIFNFTQPGNFTITIRDENGCETTVDAMTSFNASASISSLVKCHNGTDGVVEISVPEGAAPFQYSISGQPFQNENTFEGLSSGTYSFIVKDAFGNEITTNEVTLENPEELTIDISSDDFEITVNGAGGTGNLEYSIDGTNFQSGTNFLVQNNGIYTLTVRDENGCTATSDIQISVNTLVVSANLVQTISCFEGSDGALSVTVNGGTPPFKYSTDGVDFQDENTFENLSAGSYIVTILDAEGFTKQTNEVLLENPELLTLSLNSVDFEITANGTGGTGNLEYSIDGMTFQDNPVFTVQNNGVYTILVRDENGCLMSSDIEISVNTLFAELALESEPTCHNSTDAILWIGVEGGTPPYQYSLNGLDFQDELVFLDVAPGTYTGIVLDAEGFTFETNQITINSPSPIIASATVDVYDIVVEAEGGWGNFIYQLEGVSDVQVESFFECNAPDTYNIIVVDEKGCSFEIPNVVVETPTLQTDVTVNEPTCFGFQDGEFLVWAEGDATPYEFSIDGINYSSNPAFLNIEAGSYTAYVKDKCDIVSTIDFEVNQPDSLVAQVDITGPFATITPDGGTSPYQYSLDGMPFTDENEFGQLPPGNYSVEVQDNEGCLIIESFEITYEPMTFEGGIISPIDCEDTTVLIQYCIDGGEAPYSWITNPTDAPIVQYSGNCELNLQMNVPNGTYEITISDAFGISLSDTISVAITDPLEFDLNINENSIEVEVSGGTPPYEFLLNGVAQSSNIFENLPNGDYEIEVIDANGCSAFEEVNITKTIEILSEIGFEIMPNPSDGSFFLESRKALSRDLKIKILDITGKLVFESDWNRTEGTKKAINTHWLPNGVYQLILEDNQFLGAQKIIILR